jgi:hypothetical protein
MFKLKLATPTTRIVSVHVHTVSRSRPRPISTYSRETHAGHLGCSISDAARKVDSWSKENPDFSSKALCLQRHVTDQSLGSPHGPHAWTSTQLPAIWRRSPVLFISCPDCLRDESAQGVGTSLAGSSTARHLTLATHVWQTLEEA